MPRKKRDDAPGRLHHIMNRGIAKRVVFPDHAAKRRFALLLARSSVEGHVAFCVRAAVYRGADYLRVFGQQLTESEAQVVERRIRGRARDEDPLDALRSVPPPRVAAWMRRKARLADDLSPWAPILGTSCIRQHLAELKGREHVYRVHPGRNQIDAWPLLEVGLLHGAAGLCLQEIARLVGCSGSTAGIRLQRHRQVLAGDDAYALRSGQILKTLLDAAYPLGIPA